MNKPTGSPETPFSPEEPLVSEKIFLFRGMGEEETRELLRDLPLPRTYHKGEAIYTPQTFRRALGILLSGRAEAVRTTDGRRVLMNRFEPGSCFGAAALYGSGEDYVTEVLALSDCTVLFLPQETLTAFMKRDFRVAENYIRFLSDRLRFLNRRIAGFTGGAADRRLARYLLEHCGGDGAVSLPGSMVELAAALNVGRSSLYRSLDVLAEAGLIRREGRRICVTDLVRLQDAAGAE